MQGSKRRLGQVCQHVIIKSSASRVRMAMQSRLKGALKVGIHWMLLSGWEDWPADRAGLKVMEPPNGCRAEKRAPGCDPHGVMSLGRDIKEDLAFPQVVGIKGSSAFLVV